jgi:hypothetical protein
MEIDMRHAFIISLSASMMLTAFAPALSSAPPSDLVQSPGVGGFMSSNIEYVGTLASDSPGVGSAVHDMPDGGRRYYVSSVQGLRIYNIDNPGLPLLIGAFEVANWENEDVSVSQDGKTVLMSEFTGSGYTYVFQVSDPIGAYGAVTITMGDALPLSAAHIVDCIDDACDYFYGSEGQTWDARDKTNVVELSGGESWGAIIRDQMPTGTYNFSSGHNLNVAGDYDLDGDGTLERVVIADTTPMAMFDATDPLNPVLITTSNSGDHGAFGTKYQHNNKIQGFEDYVPRTEDEPLTFGDAPKVPGAAAPVTNLRTGELLLGNGETNFTATCGSGSGPLTSWSTAGWDQGEEMRVQSVFRPVNGEYDGEDGSGGNPAVNAIGCSGHWFDVRADDTNVDDIIVAAGWYEHGTRVIRVNGANGEFEQLGFYQPVVGSASAAHWVVDERFGTYIYTVDYVRGVDILKYNPEAPIESTETFDASWFAADDAMTQYSSTKRYLCRLGGGQLTQTKTITGAAAVLNRV